MVWSAGRCWDRTPDRRTAVPDRRGPARPSPDSVRAIAKPPERPIAALRLTAAPAPERRQ